MKPYLAILILLLLCMPLAPAVSQEEILPTDDSYVMADLSGNPAGALLMHMNFGRSSDLIVGYYFNETGEGEFVVSIAFLKFDLSGYEGAQNAILTLTVTDIDSSVPPMLQIYYVEDDSWNEANITFSNAPPPSQLLREVQIIQPGQITLNLTSLIPNDKVITLAFTCKNIGSQSSLLVISSKESEANRPVVALGHSPALQPYLYIFVPSTILAIILIVYVNLFKQKKEEK